MDSISRPSLKKVMPSRIVSAPLPTLPASPAIINAPSPQILHHEKKSRNIDKFACEAKS